MRSRQEIYLDLLYHGLLLIRTAAHVGDSAQCHAEADHLHNIPGLLNNLDKEGLHDHYWRLTRSIYIQVSKPDFSETYTQLWQELEEATQKERSKAE